MDRLLLAQRRVTQFQAAEELFSRGRGDIELMPAGFRHLR